MRRRSAQKASSTDLLLAHEPPSQHRAARHDPSWSARELWEMDPWQQRAAILRPATRRAGNDFV